MIIKIFAVLLLLWTVVAQSVANAASVLGNSGDVTIIAPSPLFGVKTRPQEIFPRGILGGKIKIRSVARVEDRYTISMLSSEKADFGVVGSGLTFANKGEFEYAHQDVGPQNLRTILAESIGFGFAVAADSGVKTIRDLKGKRIARVVGNRVNNIHTDALLAFANLSRDDVELVSLSSASAAKTALLANQVDAFVTFYKSRFVDEIDSSPRGLVWPEFPPEDREGWRNIRVHALNLFPKNFSDNGIRKDLIGTNRNSLVARPDKALDDLVYQFVREFYSEQQGRSLSADEMSWGLEFLREPNLAAPLHNGTIRFMKEKGLWTSEKQAYHDEFTKYITGYLEHWRKAKEDFMDYRIVERSNRASPINEEWQKYWNESKFEYEERQGCGMCMEVAGHNPGRGWTSDGGHGNSGTGDSGTGNRGTGNRGTGNRGTGNRGTGNIGAGTSDSLVADTEAEICQRKCGQFCGPDLLSACVKICRKNLLLRQEPLVHLMCRAK